VDFALVLAGHLHRTVDELFLGSPAHRPITAEEYRRWKRFYHRNPFGALRGDYNAASVIQAMYDTVGKKFKRSPPLDKLLLFSGPAKKPRRRGIDATRLKEWAILHGAKVDDAKDIDRPTQRPTDG
jgi:hypothetical protein